MSPVRKAAVSAAFALSLSAPPHPALACLPGEIEAFTQENIALCRSVGGPPNLSGLRVEGAGEAVGGRPPYLTEAGDLNGDGRPDYVTDLSGLECVGAWSLFCGSAGCVVTVWLSGPEGYTVGWGGNAQGWELRGQAFVATLHGQLCDPPRVGVQSCTVTMHFE